MQYKGYKGGVEPMEKIAVLIPCYNEEKTIKKVRQNIENCLTFLNQSYTYYSIRKTKKQTAKKYKLV